MADTIKEQILQIIPGRTICDGATGGTCDDGYFSKPYWEWVCDPEFEVKIYRG